MFQLSKWKTIPILLVVFLGFLFSLPNALSDKTLKSFPGFLPTSRMVLGLDLQGGSHIVLEVDSKKFKNELLKQLIGDLRHVVRNKVKVRYSGIGKKSADTVGITIKNLADVERVLPEFQKLTRDITSGGGMGQVLGLGGPAAALYDMSVDGNKVTFTFIQAGLNAKIGLAIQHILKILGDRINGLGTTEPTIQRQGVDRILVQVPGLQDPKQLKKIIGQTAKLTFQLACDSQPTAEGQQPPLDCEGYPQTNRGDQIMWVKTNRADVVSGETLTDAQPGFDSRDGQPVVNFRFNTGGGLQFAELTRKNVKRQFAIVLDKKIISAPVIQTAILGGSGQISGNFTVEEAKSLAIVLRSGALPAEITIVEERTVGPSLGKDSVQAGLMASIVGLIAVLIFMGFSYRLFGIFANLALLANLGLLVGILSALSATLTLPGIAGIVLTMGMAVDSNVLVFERIREEVHSGRGPLNSIETGFQRALATILDANFTTFIAAVVLFGLGSGPIKGFAVTLGLGILTTVFTAFTFTRLVVAFWVNKKRPKTVPL
jgi:protein-export membrane protein SecD